MPEDWRYEHGEIVRDAKPTSFTPPKYGIVKGLAILAAVAAVAWVLGSTVGKWINAENREDYAFLRQLHTAELLEYMGTIKVGDTLPDFGFVDLGKQSWTLSQLVSDRSAIVFFDYLCDDCIAELNEIRMAINSGVKAEKFILISSTDPAYLKVIQDSLDFPCRVLYDEERSYEDLLSIFTFPMTVTIDRELVITDISTGIVFSSQMAGLK